MTTRFFRDHVDFGARVRVAFAVAGAYLAAQLAPDRPTSHALALGAVGFLVSLVGAVTTWNAGPAFGPYWYPLALAATAIPCAWAGASLRAVQTRAS
jgi:peptidoglycan/LPS O-acetylase OafA/YrhL